jgi:hypothetical protein
VTEASVRIEKLKLRLRGLDEAAARSLAGGMGEAIARAVDAHSLIGAGSRRIERLDLGSIAAAPDATPDALRDQAASVVSAALATPNRMALGRRPPSPAGEGARG